MADLDTSRAAGCRELAAAAEYLDQASYLHVCIRKDTVSPSQFERIPGPVQQQSTLVMLTFQPSARLNIAAAEGAPSPVGSQEADSVASRIQWTYRPLHRLHGLHEMWMW